MLIEFSVENYRSFKERQTLSMVSTSDDTMLDTNTFMTKAPKDLRLNLSAIIYGPNASGKSNLIKAMQFIETFIWSSATKTQEGSTINVAPFKLDATYCKRPSSFDVMFIQEGIRYNYGIAVDEKRIHQEWLTAYPKGRRQIWFTRTLDEDQQTTHWKFGPELKGEREIIKNFVRSNSLFLSHGAQNNHPQLSTVFKWFAEKFANYIAAENVEGWTADMCAQDTQFCQEIENFLRVADSGIQGILTEEKSIKIPPDFLKMFSDEARDKITKKDDLIQIHVKTIHKLNKDGETVSFDIEEESDGTKRIFSLAGPCLDVLKKGMVLYIDEIDRSMHSKLTRHIVSLFYNKRINLNNAQLICTSHDVSLLDQKKLFRRDQIWFFEKNKEGASVLYPLSDFSPRKDESLERGYLVGRYGALPFINEGEL